MLDQVKSMVKDNGIEYFFCSFVELSGAPKAKLVPASHVDDMAREGAGFAGFAADGNGGVEHPAQRLQLRLTLLDQAKPFAHDLTRRAVGRIIKCRQLVLDGALYLFRIDVLVPFRPRDRATLVGVDLNQTGVDRKAFTTNKAGRNARPDQPLEYKPENIVIPEALIARPREHRVIWNFILDAKPAEPAIRKVDLDFAAERSL